MAEKLKELLNKINEEGVKKSDENAREIETKAKESAEIVLLDAKAEAQKIIEEARRHAEKTTQISRIALQQASRNLTLSLKEEIKKILQKIVSMETAKALSTEDMAKILSSLITNFIEKDGKTADVKVLVKKEDLEKLKKSFSSKLKDKITEGLEFKPSPNINAGFSISFDKGKSFFDFTDEGLTETLCIYLNPDLAELLKDSRR